MYRKFQFLSSLGIPKRKWLTNPSIASMLLYRKAATMPAPWFIQIEPSRRCNLSCPHCVKIDHPGVMSFDTFKRIIGGNPNVSYVKLQGLGEPLMNPDLAYMAMYAKQAGCKTELISNGTIPPNTLLMENVDCYVVSMETCDPDKYKKIRGVEIDRVISTLDLLRYKYHGKIGINCVLTDETAPDDVTNLKEFATHYRAFVTTPMMQNWLSPGVDGYEPMAQKVSDSIWAHHGAFSKSDLNQERHCHWCYNQAYYDYHGRLHPCCIRMSGVYDLGFEWNGLQMQMFRKERKGHSFCKNCPL